MSDLIPIRPTFTEIDLDNLSHNFQQIKKLVQGKKIMAVVKADGYGHGAVEVAKEVLNKGANYLGVAMLEEAIELRKAGIAAPILVLGYTPPDHADACIKYGITSTIFTYEVAKAFSERAVNMGRTAYVHLKVDTGMGRVGVTPDETVEFVKIINELPYLKVEGIFTHFSVADDKDKSYTKRQLDSFNYILTSLQEEKINIPIKHSANSAATIDLQDTHFDMVRVGLALYGLYPSPHMRKTVDLKPVMTLKSQVAFLKIVPKGTSISYGRKYITDQESKIGTLPIGYADGFSRILTNKCEALIKGIRVPVIGSICMDQCMFIANNVSNINIGDEVVIFGNQGGKEITVDEIADKLGTINYEVVCMIDKRVPRLYLKNNRVVKKKSLTSKMN
ncbi:alanine racemase [Natranaerobius trueperi]|uniref:Alanine racemase n=1 Tax=Natranaerobius trueperi TaxID=759412 RepID=A0A226BWX4_9FIRM|nr:alanine racemase [Natranaerobius trueperi]OWZ82814.1 alanine racemase [Natranaerobius trueperi]